MKGLVARLIAYVFLGSFCIAGPVLLIIALSVAAQRASLIYSGIHTNGTVIGKRQNASTRVMYAPVIQFAAADGRTYSLTSDVYDKESAFSFGEQVPVIYRQNNPSSARIDAFAQFWTFPLVFGAVGAGFSLIPSLMLATWMRRRRDRNQPGSVEPAQPAMASRGFRWSLGLLLTGTGLPLLAVAFVGSDSLEVSRILVAAVGLLLTSIGVLAGQWVPTDSRIYHALGGIAITSMAMVFGWVSLYGDARGFSGGVSAGGLKVASGTSVTAARIAFGIASVLFGLSSLWAWKQMFRQRRVTVPSAATDC